MSLSDEDKERLKRIDCEADRPDTLWLIGKLEEAETRAERLEGAARAFLREWSAYEVSRETGPVRRAARDLNAALTAPQGRADE